MDLFFSNKVTQSDRKMFANQTYDKTWGEEFFEIRRNMNPDVQFINYKMNNYGHRCDDFKDNHDGKHILFAGCSFTFGEGLSYKSNWSGKLYSLFESKDKCDGYYSLGFQNGVTSVIIHNIFRYFEQFGEPEILFCLFPDTIRKVSIDDNNELGINYRHDDYHKSMGRVNSYHSIYLLEKYCELKGIKLIWSTWDYSDLKFYSGLGFKNFLYAEEVDIIMNATNKNESDSPVYNSARDNAHPGLKYSDGLANIFMMEYINRYEK